MPFPKIRTGHGENVISQNQGENAILQNQEKVIPKTRAFPKSEIKVTQTLCPTQTVL